MKDAANEDYLTKQGLKWKSILLGAPVGRVKIYQLSGAH